MSLGTMTPARSTWTQFTIDQPRKRRAETVCTICHRKKVKCDLGERRTSGQDKCTYCANTNKVCEERLGKRGVRNQQQRTSEARGIDTVGTGAPAPAPPDMNIQYRPPRSTPRPSFHEPPRPHDRGGSFSTPATLNTEISESTRTEAAACHEGDIDTGFLQPFVLEDRAETAAVAVTQPVPSSAVAPHLLHIFLETYFDSCYAWCPVLDRHCAMEELKKSPLLANALAVVGTNLQPPIVPCDGPQAYYDRARQMFYEDAETSTSLSMRALLLFYWWAPRPSSYVHRHASWWWTKLIIIHCQQEDIHRLGTSQTSSADRAIQGLWKRIWWTAFARERLTALCQSKPPIIDPEDCTIPEPSMEDFPEDMQHSVKAYAFLYWVRLCGVIGRIARHLYRGTHMTGPIMSPPNSFATHTLHQELLSWVQDLPLPLHLGINDEYTTRYDKNVCQLHLPYLTAVIVLDLQRAPASRSTPQAGASAIIAGSCMARIFRDILARGDTRFLMAITSWYCAVSFLALLSAKQQPTLAAAAEADIQIVRLMCDQLRRTWGSANVVYQGIERLSSAVEDEEAANSLTGLQTRHVYTPSAVQNFSPSTMDGIHDGASIKQYFPFATSKTSELARLLLEQGEVNGCYSLPANAYSNYLATDMFDMFMEGLDNTDFSGVLPNF